jgi:hypothetical protein
MLADYIPKLKAQIEKFDLEQVYNDIIVFGTYEKVPLRNFTKQMYFYLDSQFAIGIDHSRLAGIVTRLEAYNAGIQEDELLYIIHSLDRIRQIYCKEIKEESASSVPSMCRHMYI